VRGAGGVDDGTSVSYGSTSAGHLRNAVELPVLGDGYRIPEPWASRGLRYGTEELVGTIVRAGRRLAVEDAAAVLYVADLSPRRVARAPGIARTRRGATPI
jgi:murein endopeptidase